MSLGLAGKEVLVIGGGLSGRSAARFCAERGARVCLADERPAEALAGLAELPTSVRLHLGRPLPAREPFDWVVPSPGVPRKRYEAGARRIAGDVELAGLALSVPVVAVTGTNGKSTTVLWIESMLRTAGWRARAAGNLGVPALSLVGEPLDVAVLEVSSFQLEAVEHFRPRLAAVLNLSPDHLDRHGDLAGYARAKRRLLEQQEPADAAVLNRDDPEVAAMAAHTRARVLFVSRRGPVERGLFLDGSCAVWRDDERSLRLPLESLPLAGEHNLENAGIALACVLDLGVDPQAALAGLHAFPGLPHRCEVVAREDGVTFVNDSKATNPGAARSALEGLAGPLWWIAGGRNKGLDFAELARAAEGRVRRALLIGEAAPELAAALAGRVETEIAGTLERAVDRAVEGARSGDTVLLAPACASFDQFEGFEARGDAFRSAVKARVTGSAS